MKLLLLAVLALVASLALAEDSQSELFSLKDAPYHCNANRLTAAEQRDSIKAFAMWLGKHQQTLKSMPPEEFQRKLLEAHEWSHLAEAEVRRNGWGAVDYSRRAGYQTSTNESPNADIGPP